jgi:predicted RNA-binding Zn-ribbon protein involved in translation (DUF1610 family)
MPRSTGVLPLLIEAYAVLTADHGPARAEDIARSVFSAEVLQRVIAAHAARVADAATEIIVAPAERTLTCPHCHAEDRILEIDRCDRRNETHAEENRVRVALQEPDFDHVTYECDACGRRVAMPHAVEIFGSST